MRRFVALLLLLAACKHPPATASLPTKDQFAALMQKALGIESRYDAKDFSLSLPADGGPPGFVFLGNAYAEYCAAPPAERDGVILRYAQSLHETENRKVETLAEVRPRLLPVVREGLYYEQADRDAADARRLQYQMWHRPISELMHLGLGIDRVSEIEMFGEGTSEKWGRPDYDALMATAMRNLRARSTEKFDNPHPGVYVSPWRDNHDSARLLLKDEIRKLPLKGAPVAMVVSRDSLIITGADDAAGLEQMAVLAEAELLKPRAMHAIPMRLDGDKWGEFLPANTPAIRATYKHLEVESLDSLYDEQRASLDKYYEERKEDIFVASYTGVRNKADDQVVSYCVWSEGVLALLPRADVVAFTGGTGKEAKPLGLADWSRVQAVAGPLMKPMGMSPERYRVEAFPTAKQLQALNLRQDLFAR